MYIEGGDRGQGGDRGGGLASMAGSGSEYKQEHKHDHECAAAPQIRAIHMRKVSACTSNLQMYDLSKLCEQTAEPSNKCGGASDNGE